MVGFFQNYNNVQKKTINAMSGKVSFQTSLIYNIQKLTT